MKSRERQRVLFTVIGITPVLLENALAKHDKAVEEGIADVLIESLNFNSDEHPDIAGVKGKLLTKNMQERCFCMSVDKTGEVTSAICCKTGLEGLRDKLRETSQAMFDDLPKEIQQMIVEELPEIKEMIEIRID